MEEADLQNELEAFVIAQTSNLLNLQFFYVHCDTKYGIGGRF
ncbi:Conserved hypothetical protein [Prochlorococcus marinus str. MIT 9303]|uniref:Uncharacterized protein n=1 Tax=Prochlorococcus marinus (strain MIT 9303) TaxID=59922 RepID=A2CCK0_PROM3|nr:Conserved hypothetical protein [Prochlorococcus marinus str. MIT 9303]